MFKSFLFCFPGKKIKKSTLLPVLAKPGTLPWLLLLLMLPVKVVEEDDVCGPPDVVVAVV